LNKCVLVTRAATVTQQLKLSAKVVFHPLFNLGAKLGFAAGVLRCIPGAARRRVIARCFHVSSYFHID
jgi:hypothetical protein